MEDPSGLVHQGRDNTGAAVVFPERRNILDQWVQYAAQQNKPNNTKDIDASLKSLGSNLGKAWSIDHEELQGDYDKIVDKLKTYETTKDKNKRREMWYDINAEQGKLLNKINHSQKTERQYVQTANAIKNDTRGLYFDDSYQALEDYAKKKVLDREDTPIVRKASTLDTFKYLADNVNYVPETKGPYSVTNADGTKRSTTKIVLDPVKLREAMAATFETMPQPYKNVLMRGESDSQPFSVKNEFLKANPGILQEPMPVQEQKYKDFIIDRAVASYAPGVKQKDSYVISNKVPGNNGINFNFGAGAATSGKAIYTVQKADDAGTYKINISDVTKGAPADNRVQTWQLTGKEFKALPGNQGVTVPDDELMTVNGKLKYIMVNENGKTVPVIGIAYESLESAPPTSKDIFEMETKIKKGQIIHIPFIDENKSQIYEYGADPMDIFEKKQSEADKIWNDRKSRSATPASQSNSNKSKPTVGIPGQRSEPKTFSKNNTVNKKPRLPK